MIKRINWDVYLTYFYDKLKINSVDRAEFPINSPIFYKIEEGTLTISFSFNPFILIVTKSIESLKIQYDRYVEENTSLSNIPTFVEWLGSTYMDGRGIPEL